MARTHLLRTLLPALILVSSIAPSVEAQTPAPPRSRAPERAGRAGARPSRVSGALPLYFMRRPATDGSRRMIGGAAEAPVLIRLDSPPTDADRRALQALGVKLELRRDGSVRGRGSVLAASLPASALSAVAALPRVKRIELDGAPFAPPRPLDGTAAWIQAPDVWRAPLLPGGAEGEPLRGKGIVVCDVDSGVDPFHPLFFRADGGYMSWADVDGDGKFSPGIDGVDLKGDGQPVVLRVLNSLVTDYFSDEPLFNSDSASYAVGMDWLYADVNASGEREYGTMAGFTEADPTYGERLFVIDDVNQNLTLDVGEKLVALGTSKIKVIHQDKKKYRRGTNLVSTPPNPNCAHGTGAAGVMVGGNIGFTRLVGIAPDAELVMATNNGGTGDVALTDFCIDEGARVVLHEYAPWMGYHLDGSSELEALIDESSQKGVAHINPAGNLSTSQKLYKHTIPAGEETVIPIEAPPDSGYGEFTFMGVSVLWRSEPPRALDLVLEGPDGASQPVTSADPEPIYTDWSEGVKLYAIREDSTRGTARVDIYVFGEAPGPTPIPLGTWKLRVKDLEPAGSPGLPLIAYVQDEASGWGKGIYFPENASEGHLIGYPGTADHGLAVAAYTGHGWHGGEAGERAYYSGRGRRIDGAEILWISAPDDPITSGYREGSPGIDFIYGGTSGASPHVAGAAALLIQADTTRTGDDVREAIKAGALVDDVVGDAPNDDYGNGKLRIYKSLYGVDPPGGSAPSIKIQRAVVPLGEDATVPITVSDPDEPASGLRIEVDRDYDGVYDEELEGGTLRATAAVVGALGVHRFKVRVTDSTGRTGAALATIEVVSNLPEPPPLGTPLVAGGGSGCSSNGASGPLGAWSIAAGALLALLFRLRDRKERVRA